MAICNSCGKKYSKLAAPVSARGVCGECFGAQLSAETQGGRNHEDSERMQKLAATSHSLHISPNHWELTYTKGDGTRNTVLLKDSVEQLAKRLMAKEEEHKDHDFAWELAFVKDGDRHVFNAGEVKEYLYKFGPKGNLVPRTRERQSGKDCQPLPTLSKEQAMPMKTKDELQPWEDPFIMHEVRMKSFNEKYGRAMCILAVIGFILFLLLTKWSMDQERDQENKHPLEYAKEHASDETVYDPLDHY